MLAYVMYGFFFHLEFHITLVAKDFWSEAAILFMMLYLDQVSRIIIIGGPHIPSILPLNSGFHTGCNLSR